MAELNERDTKLVQYLNEAYGKEKELETALEGHIAMTNRAPYKKRLQQHLKETKSHAREVERRIKKLGGSADGLTATATLISPTSSRPSRWTITISPTGQRCRVSASISAIFFSAMPAYAS